MVFKILPPENIDVQFDATFGAPRCYSFGSICDSVWFLAGSGTNEINQPNTIDGCADGSSSGSVSLQIKRLIVRSGDGEEHDPSRTLIAGEKATIIATGEYRMQL